MGRKKNLFTTKIRKYNVSGKSFYRWRQKYGGMEISEVPLAYLFELHGTPACIESDNGPEIIANRVQDRLKARHVKVRYIDPDSPWQNGHNESFNAVFGDGCRDRWLFYSVAEANSEFDRWLEEYNTERPHGALNQLTPAEFLALCEQQHKAA